MTRKETISLLTIMQAGYADSFRGMSDDVLNATVALWHGMFRDDDYNAVMMAVKSFMSHDTGRWMPTVGQIRSEMVSLCPSSGGDLTENEAWAMVYKAVCNSSYNSKEEFSRLPPMVQKAVGTPDQLRMWALMEADEVNSVIASNFQRSFRSAKAQAERLAALPPDVREFTARLSNAATAAMEAPQSKLLPKGENQF